MSSHLLWTTLIVFGLWLTGCTPTSLPTDNASAYPVVEAGQMPTGAPAEKETQAVEKGAEMQITQLALDGSGPTLLSTIDDAMRAGGGVTDHQFVEFVASDGATWQGEVLHDPEHSVYFLQQPGESLAGLRVEADAPIDPATLVDTLPAQPSLLSASPSYAEITFVRARHSGDNVWTFDVTLAHPDTGWDDYADGWHVATPDQRILGTRILLHPHVGEQPFTRSLSSVRLGPDVDQVVIRSHDLVDGYGPQTVTLSLAQSNSGDGYEVIR